jgi:hypothetical protein
MTASLPTATQPASLCYTRTAWASPWVETPLLECTSFADQAAPSHAAATFTYRYGKAILQAIGSRPKDNSVATIAKPDLKGKYVRVDVSGFGSFYGIITDVDDAAAGLLDGVPTGIQNATAMSLTWLLEHAPAVTESIVRTASGTAKISRALPFNGGTTAGKRGGAVTWKNYDTDQQCFTSQLSSTPPKAWKAADAIRYLFENFSPKNAAGSQLVKFQLAAAAAQFLDYELPQFDYHGTNLWELLNRLVDRRRGLVWFASVNTNQNAIEINVVSQNATPLQLSNSIVPANPNRSAYNFETAINIKNANVATTLHSFYDQIVVEGDRVGSVFTVRPNAAFEPDWTEDEKDEYNAGASGQTGFSALSNGDKEAANMDVRAIDKLSSVFSWWRLKTGWNGKGDTDPGAWVGFAFPKLEDDGSMNSAEAAPVFVPGLRIESYIPLRAGTDYTGTITPETGEADGREADYLAPIVLFQVTPIISADTDDAGWIHSERLNQAADAGSSKRQFQYSVDVSVRDDACGIVLRTVGAPQHFIAMDEFTAEGSYEEIPSAEGIDSDKWLATIYVLGDAFCRGVWPETSALGNLDLVRQLRIKAQNSHFDYIVPGTIVGTRYGALKKCASGGLLRDDRKRLTDHARLAYSWFGQQRKTLSLSFDGIVAGFNVGNLITTIGAGATLQTINTVITCVRYDLKRGSMQLHTQFGEMDFSL